MKINTKTVTISGTAYTLQKYVTQIDRHGNYSKVPQYAVSTEGSTKDSMTSVELIDHLTKLIAFKYDHIPGIQSKAKKIAHDFFIRLECANDPIEVPARRVDPGAPKLGRTGIPTRPLVPAF